MLYPATLLNSFIRSSILLISLFFGGVFRVLYTQYHAICKQWQLHVFFPIWMPLISSCVIAVARPPSAVPNGSGKSRHPCLGPDLKRNRFSFCPLSMELAVGSSLIFIILYESIGSQQI